MNFRTPAARIRPAPARPHAAPSVTASAPLPRMLAAWQLLRPAHWVKNVFVLAPVAFAAGQTFTSALPRAGLALAAFCVLSSAVYCFNDALDVDADRAHPTKCRRPVASGRISVTTAASLAVAMALAGLAFARWLSPLVALIAALYVANNLLYTLWLKTKVIADVVSIAIGFVLRLLAGAAAIDVAASSWLIVCGFSLALLLGFGKRRAELIVCDGRYTRATLISYTPQKLDTLMSICASISLLSYMLYTMAPDTIRTHQTDKLIYTIPFVAYGIFRFLFKVQEGKTEDPVAVLLHDRALQGTIALWVLASIFIIKAAPLVGR